MLKLKVSACLYSFGPSLVGTAAALNHSRDLINSRVDLANVKHRQDKCDNSTHVLEKKVFFLCPPSEVLPRKPGRQ